MFNNDHAQNYLSTLNIHKEGEIKKTPYLASMLHLAT